MTTRPNSYDHVNYLMRRLIPLNGHGPTASVVQAALVSPVNLKIYRIRGTALIAGSTSTNTYTVRTGTTSVGLLTLADSAALFAASADLAGLTLTAGTALNFLKGTDATGVASFLVECSVEVGQELSV